MDITITKTDLLPDQRNIVLIGTNETDYQKYGLSELEANYVKSKFERDSHLILINRYTHYITVYATEGKKATETCEKARRIGSKISDKLNSDKQQNITIVKIDTTTDVGLALVEGIVLGNYRFLKYDSKADKKTPTLTNIAILDKDVSLQDIDSLTAVTKGTYYARNLVNEPFSHLNSVQLAHEFKHIGDEAGFSVEILYKEQIEKEKMGGLLAVNRGSAFSPTFSIMTWKPDNATNKDPFVLIGKGLVFDTGGYSLKPTQGSMDFMKCDMAGSAAVVGTLYAIAKTKLPIYVIGLVAATDNCINSNAYVPGDVITTMSKTTVEVLNTDAEGRLTLADALHYAKRLHPKLVIDIATLTGSAAMIVGKLGIIAMGNTDENMTRMKQSGDKTYERIVEMPLWDEFQEMIKSDIADLKNIGGKESGAMTAGKFLEHFTDYPWIHLDIAGNAFLSSKEYYLSKGATGTGTRLLYDFLKNYNS